MNSARPRPSTPLPRSRANGPSGAVTWNGTWFRPPRAGRGLRAVFAAGPGFPHRNGGRVTAGRRRLPAQHPALRRGSAGCQPGVVEAVRSVAAELEATPAQVALAWLLAHGKRLGLPVGPDSRHPQSAPHRRKPGRPVTRVECRPTGRARRRRGRRRRLPVRGSAVGVAGTRVGAASGPPLFAVAAERTNRRASAFRYWNPR